jgi:hypothetical protein
MILIAAASVMASHAPRAPTSPRGHEFVEAQIDPRPGPSRIIIAKQTAPPENSHAAFADHWAMQLIDQKLIKNQRQSTIECSERPMTHAEPSAPVRFEPTDPSSDAGASPETHGRAASRWPGMTIRKDAGWLDPGTRWGPEGSAIIRADIDKIKILYGITRGRRTTAHTWSATSRRTWRGRRCPRCPRLPGLRNSA